MCVVDVVCVCLYVTPSCGPGVYTQLQKCISYLESCGFAEGSIPRPLTTVLVTCPELPWQRRGQSIHFLLGLSSPERWTLFPFHLRPRNVTSEHPMAFLVTSVQNLSLCCCSLVVPFIPASQNEGLKSLALPFVLLSSSTPALLFSVSISQVSHLVIIVTTFAGRTV